ncbi:MAG TPA: NADPH-dependent FMN reductase [Rhodanobacteraceae bacterium]|nr:NADPH-dependent FMN reductase [Rhodanobacteraceae bacterium]
MTARLRQVLCLSGSLRGRSSNTAALLAAATRAPATLAFAFYRGMEGLPAFNPDVEMTVLPAPVQALRDAVNTADALLIACPEYAHGVPGAFKNLLDWLVGSEHFPGKPVLQLNVSGRGAQHAQAALSEVLRTMSARLLSEQPFRVGLPARGCDVDEVLANAACCAELDVALDHLAASLLRVE